MEDLSELRAEAEQLEEHIQALEAVTAPEVPTGPDLAHDSAVEAPATMADLAAATPESDDFSVGEWGGVPNYSCKHYWLGNPAVRCPYETTDIDKMLTHLVRDRARHLRPNLTIYEHALQMKGN